MSRPREAAPRPGPGPTVRRELARAATSDVAGAVEGVAHVEIDAESHLDLVRRLDVMRTPTIFVLDADGRVVKRASGAPRKADVLAALGVAIPVAER